MTIAENICNFLKNKRVLILGFGREGQSTLRFMQQHGMDRANVTIADQNQVELSEFGEIAHYFGEDYLKILDDYDVILKSPGVPLKDFVSQTVKTKITSQTDLFLRYVPNKIIGITGTKGKSTTSSLLYHILVHNQKECCLLGNIGIPAFSEIDHIRESTLLVYEMSSHQLEYVHSSPDIAVLLNIYPEHLDHYTSFAAYCDAKSNIYRYQTAKDWLLYKDDCENIDKVEIAAAPMHKIGLHDGTSIEPIATHLLGKHNLYNIAAAVQVAQILGISSADAKKAVESFHGLPHRLEYVGMAEGIHYYNDSIATMPEAVERAIECFPHVDTLLVGGKDRGIPYDTFAEYLEKSTVSHILLMPDSGNHIYSMVKDTAKFQLVDDLKEAVAIAKQITPKGGICLLSPAAASYGFFKNFEERGDFFKQEALGTTGCK